VLAWNFFSSAIQNISGSLVGNAQVVRKIYFPRLVLPASSAIVSVVDFAVSLGLFSLVLAWYAYMPPWQVVCLPLVVLWTALLSLGAGLWFATLNAEYRDFRFVVPYMVQVGLYVSPVGMDSNIIPANYRLLYSLNPMAGVIDAMRWCTIHDYQLYWPSIFISLSVTLVMLYTGVKYFRSRERAVADVL
jgi:lipopolysaccharide transport system permease protein